MMKYEVLFTKVKAWLADKDAEALRCQQQLVEEEEAAQKRYLVKSNTIEV